MNTKEIARLTYKCKLCVEKQQQQTVQLTELTKKIDELEANQADSVVKMQENKEKIKKQDKDMKATQTEMKKYMDQLEKKTGDEASMRMANVIMVERVDEFKKVIQTLELIVSEQKKEMVTLKEQKRTLHDGAPVDENEDRQAGQENNNNEGGEKGKKNNGDCRNYAFYKHCKFETMCRYQHKRICKTHAKGSECVFGEKCRYSHDLSYRCKREMMAEGCKFGERCRFGHVYSGEEWSRWHSWNRNEYSRVEQVNPQSSSTWNNRRERNDQNSFWGNKEQTPDSYDRSRIRHDEHRDDGEPRQGASYRSGRDELRTMREDLGKDMQEKMTFLVNQIRGQIQQMFAPANSVQQTGATINQGQPPQVLQRQ